MSELLCTNDQETKRNTDSTLPKKVYNSLTLHVHAVNKQPVWWTEASKYINGRKLVKAPSKLIDFSCPNYESRNILFLAENTTSKLFKGPNYSGKYGNELYC